MSRRIYDNGQLLEEWDDAAGAHRRYSDGSVVEERLYTTDEAAPIVEREAEDLRQATSDRLREQLAAGVADIIAARTAATADQARAEALRAHALDAAAATLAQRTAVEAFTPSATYSAAQLGQVRNVIADTLKRVEQIQQALADFYAYRAQVDANAVLTDNALLWLARLASGALDGMEQDDEPPAQAGESIA